MDHLGGIGFFVRAADAGSFAGAAKSLGVTPSAVSKAVSRLEARLGVELFRRSTRSIELTDDGRAFFERVRHGLSEIEAAEDFLLAHRTVPRGTLRLSVPVVFGHRIVAPLIPAFRDRYPEVDVDMHSTDGFSDLVEGGFDVLIRTRALRDSALIARKLIDTRFVTAASPDYVERFGAPETPESLSEHACLAYVFPSNRRRFAWPFSTDGETFTVPPGRSLAFSNADAMIAAAEEGAGIIHLQDYMLKPSIEAGRLVPLLTGFAADGGPVSAVYLASRHLSPKVRAFVDFLSDACAAKYR